MNEVCGIFYTQDYAAYTAAIATVTSMSCGEGIVLRREIVDYAGEDVMEQTEAIFRSLCQTYPNAIVVFQRTGGYEIDHKAPAREFLTADWAYIPQKEMA